jgi:membrane protease subunit (stomatin/prohibitin family)
MSLFGRIFGAVREQYVARPRGMEGQLLYRHPNQNIPRGARLTVRSDEKAVFFRYGRLLSVLEPGEHVIDTAGMPFLDALLIRPVTGGDHFIAELFFVREAEHIHTVRDRSLGTFQEPTSNLVVNVHVQARFGVRVTDAPTLIATLAGQAESASDSVGEYLDGRVTSMLAAVVGQLVGHAQVLPLVSNQYSEETGQRVKELVGGEFRSNGLELVRFLELKFGLDESSSKAVQAFSSARADLAIQREGAQVAQTPGFAAFHLAQGHRAALEGLGEGLSTGQMGPLIGGFSALGGGGYGGGYVGTPRPAPVIGKPLAPAPPPDPSAAPWYLEGPRGPEGPFSLKQLKMRLRTVDSSARNVARVRMGFGSWQSVDETPELADLAARGAPPPPAFGHSSDAAFSAALADNVLTRDELDHIVRLLQREVPAASADDLRAKVLERALSEGAVYEGSGTFNLFDGTTQHEAVSLRRARALIDASPEKPWHVWRPGWESWKTLSAVPELLR